MSLKKVTQILIAVIFLGFSVHLAGEHAKGLPMFARRYGVPCSTCHTSAPRLNETGYKFRAAGFRMPDEIGKDVERKIKFTDYMGFRLQPRLDVVRTSEGSKDDTKTDVRLFAAEAYVWYGPLTKHLSSNLKVSLWPEESNETEFNERVEGNIRFNYGNADHFVDIRAGVPHPMEGFGGSEYYVVSNTRPFIHELRTANFNQDTFFTTIGFHQAALTLGYHYKGTTIRGLILSGLRLDVDDDEGKLEAFGRKHPFTKALRQSEKSGPDYQLFFNQILHPDGGNISLYYYKGQSFLPRLDLLNQPKPKNDHDDDHGLRDLHSVARRLSVAGKFPTGPVISHGHGGVNPVDPSGNIIDLEKLPFFENDFNRIGFYAGYPIDKVKLLYGIQRGRDTIGGGGKFTSLGQFAEAMVTVANDISSVGVRYDWFDPARNKSGNTVQGLTAYLNVWLREELRITPEYQHLVFNQGTLRPDRKEDIFQLRLYWVK